MMFPQVERIFRETWPNLLPTRSPTEYSGLNGKGRQNARTAPDRAEREKEAPRMTDQDRRFQIQRDAKGFRVVDTRTGILHSARIADRDRAQRQADDLNARLPDQQANGR